jgi:hypothetical protein
VTAHEGDDDEFDVSHISFVCIKSLQWSRMVAEMMNKSGIEVAEMYKTANLLLRRGHWLVCDGLDLLC